MNPYRLPEDYLRKLLKDQNSPYVFLESLRFDKENIGSFLFSDFSDIITFNYRDDLDSLFRKIESYLNKGYWLAGYFAYEFGYLLEPSLCSLAKENKEPLVWLGVCKKLKNISKNHGFKEFSLDVADNYQIQNLRPNISQAQYLNQIEKIKGYLAQGLTYQVNFTFKVKFDFQGNFLDCYSNLRRSQPTAYAAVINTGSNKIISLSPELFFRIKDNKITVRPMKGTSKRGVTLSEDEQLRRALTRSKKIKSENIMIVDLLRNDLGRVAESVLVSKLFEIEKYRTLYQMTSTIEAALRSNLKLKDLFSSLFPCGSVTGAPKIKTMQLIHELEKEPRGVYTGAIGYISPQGESCFSVAIRTIKLKGAKGEIGVGGGIVYDSIDNSEHEEALLKAKFFVQGFPKLELIESFLLVDGKYQFLNLHLKRLKRSSEYFSIPLDIGAIRSRLKKIASEAKGKFKVRLLVGLQGNFKLGKEPLGETTAPVRVKVALERTDPGDSYLYHKTTKRKLYDQERVKANKEGFFEVIFLNIYRELTEGTISNIFILKQGKLYTPVLKCGLLPGIFREQLLKEGKAKEKILYLKDLGEADKIYIGNSLRGLVEAKAVIPEKLLKTIEKIEVS